MMSKLSLLLIVAMTSLFMTQRSEAGQWSEACKQAGTQSQSACKAASAAAQSADSAQAQSNMSRFSGKNADQIKNPADALKQQGLDQANRLNNAKSKCEEEKQKCENKCQEEEQKRQQQVASDPQKTQPKTQEAIADQGPLENEKQNTCIMPLLAMIGDLGSGAGAANQAANKSGQTSGSSTGMPMPLPIPLGGGKDDKGQEKSDLTGNTGGVGSDLNCETAGSSRYSDCNSHFVDKCSSQMTASGCTNFINRYCGGSGSSTSGSSQEEANDRSDSTSSSSGGTDSISLSAQSISTVTANLVVDKKGEGLGSAFCTQVSGAKFCQTPGRSNCASCQGLTASGSTTAQLQAAQQACPTDPIFLDSAILAKLNGSSSEATTNLPVVSTQSLNSNSPENNSSSNSKNGYKTASLNVDDVSRAPTAVAVTKASEDVSSQHGPDLFSIQSSTYRDLCSNGRVLHCRR